MDKFSIQQAEDAAKSLNKAFKNEDDTRLIKEIVGHTNNQRQLIKERYFIHYGRSLVEDIKLDINGHFLDCVLALLESHDIYEAICVGNAIKGTAINEKVVIQMICPKEAHDIEILKKAYKKHYHVDLDFSRGENSNLAKILGSILSGTRSSSQDIDIDLAKAEAIHLFDIGSDKLGTNESKLIEILCLRSFKHIEAVCYEYFKLSNKSIEKSIKESMSGNLERACLAIVKTAKDGSSAYYAEQIHQALSGTGTKDSDLIRLLVCRSEVNLEELKHQYQKSYHKSLHDAVKLEMFDSVYESLILALIGK